MKKVLGSRRLLVAGTVALAFLSAVIGIRFYPYAYATAWHCMNGNHAVIGERQIRLPVLWWEEKGSGWNDKSLVERGVLSIVRAYPANSSDPPRIVVRPASPWEVGTTDQKIRESKQALIAELNHGLNVRWFRSRLS